MTKTSKKKKSSTNKNSVLFPVVLILLVVAAVVLIIVLSQGAKTGSFNEKSALDPYATPQLVGTKQYASEPPMLIDTNKKYTATVTMAKGGTFEIELFADKAPKTVNSFVFLARNGYFDGVTFHRVLDGFMAQGGDPTGIGSGGPGYKFEYEDSGYSFDKAGVVAMANTGPRTATNGSQFFITFGATPQLDGGYTIFGQVISGMDVVDGLTRRNPQENPDFTGDEIESITISEE